MHSVDEFGQNSKIGRSFDESSSPKVGALPVKSQYLKNRTVKKKIDSLDEFGTQKSSRIGCSFEKNLSPAFFSKSEVEIRTSEGWLI